MVMSDMFRPTDRALAFGEQYAAVLARWSELFKAASELVEANVELGRMTTDAAKEFDQLLRQSANAPWNWFGPEMVQRFMEAMAPQTKPRSQ
jgi:polyhydroxyalkanoate synthesis regulator phasin